LRPIGIPRPGGPLIWIRCSDSTALNPLIGLARQVAEDGDRITFLVTTDQELATSPPANVILQPPPADNQASARAFLDHWQPNLLLWMNGALDPLTLVESDRLRIPRLLVDATTAELDVSVGAWMPGVTRSLLERFDFSLAVDARAVAWLRRAGLPSDRIELAGALDDSVEVLPCNEAERRDLARSIGNRPVWLAVDLPEAEVPMIAEAHRFASKGTHRLLLVLSTLDHAQGPTIAAQMRGSGFEVALRSEGEDPSEAVQVYVADIPDERGLWFRLAPMSYFGGSFTRNPCNPLHAAALGSAILHGPQTAPFDEAFRRLAKTGASRPLRDRPELGRAVDELLAPDKTAALAHAAWEVTSRGAEVSNRLTDLIHHYLDKMGD
jgi:3-deoxy-D-manno-octulosonic-acid transferase